MWTAPYFNNIVGIIYAAIVVMCVVVVLSENRNPIRQLAWIIALITLPVAGLIFYMFFGRSLKSMHLLNRHNKRKLLHDRKPNRVDLNAIGLGEKHKNLISLTDALTRAPLTINNEVEIFTDGKSKFESLIEDIKNARQNIYIQYYIFNDDKLGNQIANLLIQKVQEGVDVRVMYDHVGSFSAANKFFRRMRKAGVDTHPFFRVTFPQLANRINWRNHRKIVVIDNTIGYIGGMNIADRYVNGMENGKAWRDTHLRIEGDIVESLIYSFALDWNFLKKEPTLTPSAGKKHQIRNITGIQLITSGPVEKFDNLTLVFLKAIGAAKKSIYIQTPYFLPTDSLLGALEAAALAKIDVRIMLPGESDSRMLEFASMSYVTQCLEAGIKVYKYKPGMLHSKMMIVDDEFVTTGSTNFDFRSFENNFESNLLIYDKEINRRMRDIFFTDLKECEKLRLSEWKHRSPFYKLMESLIRLFAPIL